MSLNNNNLLENNLLIVDDEVEITKSLARQFRRKYNVFTATNPVDAFPIMENENIQVVISDQRMPGMTGVDFFSKIKDKYPDALKLIITGYSDIEAVVGAINEGQVFRYITKPWNPVELDAIIKEAFEKHELITKNRKLMINLQESKANLEEKVKERTKELEDANEKLKDLNIEKNKYIGIVAHDLRNPIGSAFSFSSLLLNDFEQYSKDDKIKFLTIINKRSVFALNLISDLLDVSKIESGVFELNIKEYDYIEFINENVRQELILARNKSIEIEIEADHNSIILSFDRDKMEQVFNNLLSNAIKFSMPDTTIRVKVWKSENEVITSIIDQGQGIPPDEIDQIFTPFQVSSKVKTTNNEKSTGLGLAIVKKIIDVHRGSINVESKFGEGTIITFKLPIII